MANVHDLKNMRQMFKNLMERCKDERVSTNSHFKKLNLELTKLKFEQADFRKSYEIMKELEFCDQKLFPLLYAFKQEDQNSLLALGYEVAEEFQKDKGNVKMFIEAEANIR